MAPLEDQFGRQGGGRHDSKLDLSTCVNAYGPPPAVLEASKQVPTSLIHEHPNDAEGTFQDVYSAYLHVDPSDLLVTRGISGAIWNLASSISAKETTIPLPGYTEFFRAFPSANRIESKTSFHNVEQLEQALKNSTYCFISNPHNPTGTILDRESISGLLERHPSSVLIVDESYMDFCDESHDKSLLGMEAENLIVLRSPTKFFGIAGIRLGAAWTRDRDLHHLLVEHRETWPVSPIDVYLAQIAITQSDEWIESSRKQLQDDRLWLEQYLTRQSCTWDPGQLHFVLVTGDPSNLEEKLETDGVAVRRLGISHGLYRSAFRITAPPIDKRNLLP